MNEEQFADIMKELMVKIEDGPGSHTYVLAKIAEKHAIKMKEFQEIFAEISDSMGTVRLMLKYLLFDLEATRRERDELRTMLEDNNDSKG